MYGVISDTHCHNWTTFGKIGPNKINTRLEIILNEIKRAAKEVKEQGGNFLFHAGDLFHVRGSVSPSVLNPTLDAFREIVAMGVKPVLICGNHDAEFRDATEEGSAVTAFRSIGCHVINKHFQMIESNYGAWVVCIPWIADKSEFLKQIEEIPVALGDKGTVLSLDIVTHVALDGVFAHIKTAQCVSPEEIKTHLGEYSKVLRYVFAGHLHNHRDLGDGFYSVGAIAHHNWGDVHSKAGFLLVEDDADATGVQFRASRAPSFIDLSKETSPDEAVLEADGNYVRASLVDPTGPEIEEFREGLLEMGALGVTILVQPGSKKTEGRIDIQETESLEAVTEKYIEAFYVENPLKNDIKCKAIEMLMESEK